MFEQLVSIHGSKMIEINMSSLVSKPFKPALRRRQEIGEIKRNDIVTYLQLCTKRFQTVAQPAFPAVNNLESPILGLKNQPTLGHL
jgi:hypothetical protein